ncbi:MAG: hypothetical protein IPK68_21375 [Bdellovibrionales bacterium]|nr:hypothetical protein [Bdellovibrionales bacterium]
MNAKKSFYPSEETKPYLDQIPKGQFSSRINELILKGRALEQQLKVKNDYIQFNEALSNQKPPGKDKSGLSITMMMSEKAFEPEDEAEDFF